MAQKSTQRKAIALLITVFFIMLITLSVGVGLKYINEGKRSVDSEQFIFQSAMILEDVLQVLKTSKELEEVDSASALNTFLLTSEVIPFESNGVQILIKISSARSKINPSVLKDAEAMKAFQNYLMKKNINPVYANYLLDAMSGYKEDQTYTTDIFNINPTLYRDYISSQEHLEAINELYVSSYHDASVKYLDTQKIFNTSKDANHTLDLNFASASTFEIILGCDEMRAQELSLDERVVESVEDLNLLDAEKLNLSRFKTSFFEAFIDVDVQVIQKDTTSKIRFEYNIKSKKGSNFVFEV